MSVLPKRTQVIVKDLIFQEKHNLSNTQIDVMAYVFNALTWAIKVKGFMIITNNKITSDLPHISPKTLESSLRALKKAELIETEMMIVKKWSGVRVRGVRITEKGMEYNSAYYSVESKVVLDDLKKEIERLKSIIKGVEIPKKSKKKKKKKKSKKSKKEEKVKKVKKAPKQKKSKPKVRTIKGLKEKERTIEERNELIKMAQRPKEDRPKNLIDLPMMPPIPMKSRESVKEEPKPEEKSAKTDEKVIKDEFKKIQEEITNEDLENILTDEKQGDMIKGILNSIQKKMEDRKTETNTPPQVNEYVKKSIEEIFAEDNVSYSKVDLVKSIPTIDVDDSLPYIEKRNQLIEKRKKIKEEMQKEREAVLKAKKEKEEREAKLEAKRRGEVVEEKDNSEEKKKLEPQTIVQPSPDVIIQEQARKELGIDRTIMMLPSLPVKGYEKFIEVIKDEYAGTGRSICNMVRGWERTTEFIINESRELIMKTMAGPQARITGKEKGKFWRWLYRRQHRVGRIFPDFGLSVFDLNYIYHDERIKMGEQIFRVHKIIQQEADLVVVTLVDSKGKIAKIRESGKPIKMTSKFCNNMLYQIITD